MARDRRFDGHGILGVLSETGSMVADELLGDIVQDAESAVIKVVCKSWDEFAARVTSTVGRHIATKLYRGHSQNDWELSSVSESKVECIS